MSEDRIPAHCPTKPHFRIFYFPALDNPASYLTRCELTRVLVQKVKTGVGWSPVLDLPQICSRTS